MAPSASYIEALLRSSLDEAQRRAFRAAFEYLIAKVGEQISNEISEVDLSSKADVVHTHAAADIVSGILDAARIPDLDAAKITTGTIDNARLDGNITHDDVAETITAAWTFNAAITAPNTPRCMAYHSTTQSIANNSQVMLNFDSEDFDVGGMHDPSTNPSRITIPAGQGGLYLISGHVDYASNTTGSRRAEIFVNGTRVYRTTLGPPNTGFGMEATTLRVLAAGDYVELGGFQDSGGSLATGNASSLAANRLFVVRLW